MSYGPLQPTAVKAAFHIIIKHHGVLFTGYDSSLCEAVSVPLGRFVGIAIAWSIFHTCGGVEVDTVQSISWFYC